MEYFSNFKLDEVIKGAVLQVRSWEEAGEVRKLLLPFYDFFASLASFSMSLYSSTVPLLRASALLKKTSKLSENNIELEIKVRYTIRNPVFYPIRATWYITFLRYSVNS